MTSPAAIELICLDNPRAAQALTDYLLSQQIQVFLNIEEFEATVFLTDTTKLEQALTICHEFADNPNQSKYLSASWATGQTHNQFDYGNGSLNLLQQFWHHAGVITLSIFFACVLLFIGTQTIYAEPLFATLGFVGVHLDSSWAEIWRLFTPNLLHADAMHLVFNVFWWWYLAGTIETKHSRISLLWLLLLAGTLPNIVQYLWTGPLFLGLSGVVYALASYTWLYGLKVPSANIYLPTPYMGMMLLWLILGFTGFMNMANGAHLAGLIIGLLIAGLDIKINQRSEKSSTQITQ